MSGTRLVYGDGLDDLKDCFSGTFGLNTTRSSVGSRQRVYGGDHYVAPHHLRNSDNQCCPDLGEVSESCTKTRCGMTVLFLWLIILTIVCIALGSNIGKDFSFRPGPLRPLFFPLDIDCGAFEVDFVDFQALQVSKCFQQSLLFVVIVVTDFCI